MCYILNKRLPFVYLHSCGMINIWIQIWFSITWPVSAIDEKTTDSRDLSNIFDWLQLDCYADPMLPIDQ